MKPNWKNQEELDQEEVLVAEDDVQEQEPAVLIIYDDPISTFETVIDSLVKYCKHERT